MASKLFRNSAFLQKLKNLKIQKRNYGHDHHVTKLEVDLANRNTMDLLPQPKGSWKELNDKRQAVNNAFLVGGALILLSSIVGTIQLGMWDDALFRPPVNKINKDFPGARYSSE